MAVPVFDTAQGTGDRLPYQASWGQSITWPLRFVVTSEFYVLVRAIFFLVAGLFLCLSTLQSWLPALTARTATMFGLLINSSYGLFLRQNDWSDHYVQVVGIAAAAMFLMRREFHLAGPIARGSESNLLLACLFVSVNGVVTGHPGLWPVALFVWLSVVLVFVTEKTFRQSIVDRIRSQARFALVAIVASIATVLVVAGDLLAELSAEVWTVGRLSRTQGLFSEFAFGGLYGLSDGGALPGEIKRVISSVLATIAMPAFMMLDFALPSYLRASDFRELSRVEFSGSLVLVAFVVSWRAWVRSPVRKLLARVLMSQLIIWATVILSVMDRLPPVLASSGAWMALAVVLIFNVFVSFLMLGTLPQRFRFARGAVVGNLALVAYWLLFQFGFTAFGSTLQIPQRFPSRVDSTNTLSVSEWHKNLDPAVGRVLLVSTPSFYDFLPFVSLGYSVVAPADPKMRASGQLQSSFAFNYSINSPNFEVMSSGEVDRTLDFLQVRYLLVGKSTQSDAPQPARLSEGLKAVLDELGTPEILALPQATFEIYSRSRFSAFVVSGAATTNTETCPSLFEACPVITETARLTAAENSRLQPCRRDCLWTFRTPAVGGAGRLVIPVTYDGALNVRDVRGVPLETSRFGGFLAVRAADGIGEGVLTLSLSTPIFACSHECS